MTAPLEQLHDILPGPQPDVLDEQSIILIARVAKNDSLFFLVIN